jgi:hypothetical protein
VVKQSNNRIVPQQTLIATTAAPWMDAYVANRWPMPVRAGEDDASLMLARLITEAVLDDIRERAFLDLIESKLRWLHDIGAGEYYTAANPLT